METRRDLGIWQSKIPQATCCGAEKSNQSYLLSLLFFSSLALFPLVLSWSAFSSLSLLTCLYLKHLSVENRLLGLILVQLDIVYLWIGTYIPFLLYVNIDIIQFKFVFILVILYYFLLLSFYGNLVLLPPLCSFSSVSVLLCFFLSLLF